AELRSRVESCVV
ncbi:hypothetical protein A2U01_0055398, partial [Trifolium medium]|nr:hypothetical protein [Trifolium medium]